MAPAADFSSRFVLGGGEVVSGVMAITEWWIA
jgi:hypothetical protein